MPAHNPPETRCLRTSPAPCPGHASRVMTREDQRCLLLAFGQLTPEVRSRTLELLAASLPWLLILRCAHDHHVYPLLYHSLRDLGFAGVPKPVEAELKSESRAGEYRRRNTGEEVKVYNGSSLLDHHRAALR